MKVCTDACLFGAWLVEDSDLLNGKNVLDIGTGTGLLSLMFAQGILANNHNFDGKITGVEIETNAAKEAKSNFEASPWKENIILENISIQCFNNTEHSLDNLYDCIVSNPPFFEGDLQSTNTNKNLALHSIALSWKDLLFHVDRLLKEDGHFFVLIPAIRAYTMQKLATEKGIALEEEVVIFNAAKQKPFRVIQKFKKTNEEIKQIKRSNFIIKDNKNNYTEAFIELLKPFYLHL
jgi:tRNA1Val (adenine37-N6)-methyltransferase